MSGNNNIFESAMGTLSGLIGAIGGMSCAGLIVALAILMIPVFCCVVPILIGGSGGGSP